MITLVLPGRAHVGGHHVTRFAENVVDFLWHSAAHVSIFSYTEDSVMLIHPKRNVMLQIATVQDGKVRLTVDPSKVLGFFGQTVEEGNKTWATKQIRGIIKQGSREETPCCAVEALRVAALLSQYSPSSKPNLTLFVGNSSQHPDLEQAHRSVAIRARLVPVFIDCCDKQNSESWRQSATQLGGSYLRCLNLEDFGSKIAEAMGTWAKEPLQSRNVPDTELGRLRSKAGGCFFERAPRDSPLLPLLERCDLSLLRQSSQLREAEAQASARARAIGWRQGTVFWSLPLRIHREDGAVRVWANVNNETPLVVTGNSALDIMPACQMRKGISNGLPLFLDVDQAINLFESQGILRRLAELAEQDNWQDPLLPMKVYVPIIQKQLGFLAKADKSNFCGMPAFKAIVRSLVLSTDEGTIRKICHIGFHPKAKKLTASSMAELSECWAAWGVIGCLLRSVAIYTRAVGKMRDQFLRSHSRRLMKERRDRRNEATHPRDDDVEQKARQMQKRMEAKGIRKTLAQCTKAVHESARRDKQRNARREAMDPVLRETKDLEEKKDQQEVAKILKSLIDTGFVGAQIDFPWAAARKIEGWELGHVSTIFESLESISRAEGQVPRLRRGEGAEIAKWVRALARNFDVYLFGTDAKAQ